MADRNFQHVGHVGEELRQVVLAEIVAGVHPEAKRLGFARRPAA